MLVKTISEVKFTNTKGSKKELVESLDKIYNDIKDNKNLTKFKADDELDRKYVELYKMQNKCTSELYHYNTKNYHYNILKISSETKTIFFVIRDNELDSYFKNYFKAETIENIQKLSPDKIIDKLNKFDFLIYEDMITLLHKDNDFTENK